MNHNCKSRTALPTPEHTEDLDDLFASVAYKVPKAFEYLSLLSLDSFPTEINLRRINSCEDLREVVRPRRSLTISTPGLKGPVLRRTGQDYSSSQKVQLEHLKLTRDVEREIFTMRELENTLKALYEEYEAAFCDLISIKAKKKATFDGLLSSHKQRLRSASQELQRVSDALEEHKRGIRGFKKILSSLNPIWAGYLQELKGTRLEDQEAQLLCFKSQAKAIYLKALYDLRRVYRSRNIELNHLDVIYEKTEHYMEYLSRKVEERMIENEKLSLIYNELIASYAL